jgi:hypothetical protein
MAAVFLLLACGLGALFWFVARGKAMPSLRSWPNWLRFLPFLTSSTILIFYFLTDRGVLSFSQSEHTYGLFVVFLLPIAGALLLVQFAIVLRILAERKADL